MLFEINYTKQYKKREQKFFKKHQNLIGKYAKVLSLLELNPFHPSLRLHKLSGNIDGLHSISIDMQYRMTMEFYIEDKKIVPVHIGTHDTVYK